MTRYLTIAEVSQATGITPREVARWVAKANPRRFRGRVRRAGRLYWRADALVEWLNETGRPQHAERVQSYCVATPGQSLPQKPRKPRARAKAPAGAPADIFVAKEHVGRLFMEAVSVASGDANATRQAAAMGDLLRKLELDCLEVDERLRRVIPMAAVEKIVGRMLSEARTNLQTLRYSMVDDLAAMTDKAQLARYLDDRFSASLRSLEEGYLAAEVAAYLPEGGDHGR